MDIKINEKEFQYDWKQSCVCVRKGHYDLFFVSPPKVVAILNRTTNKTDFFENALVMIDGENDSRLLLNTYFDVCIRIVDLQSKTFYFYLHVQSFSIIHSKVRRSYQEQSNVCSKPILSNIITFVFYK